jgi:hypothetical protein
VVARPGERRTDGRLERLTPEYPVPVGASVDQVVIHVIRNSRAASVVADVLAGHRPSIWVSDLYSVNHRFGIRPSPRPRAFVL